MSSCLQHPDLFIEKSYPSFLQMEFKVANIIKTYQYIKLSGPAISTDLGSVGKRPTQPLRFGFLRAAEVFSTPKPEVVCFACNGRPDINSDGERLLVASADLRKSFHPQLKHVSKQGGFDLIHHL